MKKEIGNKKFSLWLIGDSNPENWQGVLSAPLDPRHPARHNIWTSVLDVIQDELFRKSKIRLETRMLYIRNAVENPKDRPKANAVEWSSKVEREIDILRNDLTEFRPKIVICFGRFAFEFSRRAFGETLHRKSDFWNTKNLGNEFRQRLSAFSPGVMSLIPLLHTSISRGKFISSHRYFCQQGDDANYFDYVGIQIASKLREYEKQLDIWVES